MIRRSFAASISCACRPAACSRKPASVATLVVLLVGLGGAAQRAEVLEHPLGVAAAIGVRGVVALVLVVADQPARQRHRRDHDVAERPSGVELAADLLERGAELDQPQARGLGADAVELVRRGRWRRSGRRGAARAPMRPAW